MAPKTILGNADMGKKIKARRNELGLTIEEAASRAGVGTKTWSRYEAGESIRRDKCKGVCKALNWHALPDQEDDEQAAVYDYKNGGAWSRYLEENFGEDAAISFAAGSDMLLDHIEEDMDGLASMPRGTHIGQLPVSWLADVLPQQFLMRYDYEFMYQMKCALMKLRACTSAGQPMIAHTVQEELLLYLCSEEASVLTDLNGQTDGDDEWVFDVLGDMDVVTCLYSDRNLEEDNIYHFSHWTEQQFYVDKEAENV